MHIDHKITLVTVVFVVFGLIFLSNVVIPPEPVFSNAAVVENPPIVGFVVAEGAPPQPNTPDNSLSSKINGFLAKNKLSSEDKIANLPIYIILNMMFIILTIFIYNRYRKR